MARCIEKNTPKAEQWRRQLGAANARERRYKQEIADLKAKLNRVCAYAWVDESDPSTGYEGGFFRTACGRELEDYDEDWIRCPWCGGTIGKEQ